MLSVLELVIFSLDSLENFNSVKFFFYLQVLSASAYYYLLPLRVMDLKFIEALLKLFFCMGELMGDLAEHFGKRTQNQHAEKEHVRTQQGFTCINKLILCFIIYHKFRINTSVPT